MADEITRARKLRELVEESRFWDASDLMRNFDEEFHRIEMGMGHTAWDSMYRPISICVRPLPTVPRFETSETKDEISLRVVLPGVPPGNVHIDVDRRSIEVSACSDDLICKPYYVSVESHNTLDPDSVEAKQEGRWLVIRVRKVKKRRVEIR
ncbi:MAG: Hsp20/alpha crystallin family protein [Candidatus Thermoplasmatota archaeon]|nr:Hsp20/alpha crystallin family protein [Candidatus Thermoplasmatota archaeon]